MPWSPDHWALLALVNIAILTTMAIRRSWHLDAVTAALPAARAITLITYTYAAVAKYNSSFFDIAASCANAIGYRASFGTAASLRDSGVLIWVVLAAETAIPLLLLIPATRRHGVRLGVAFHFFLSASPAFAVVDYTAALYALFLLFLPEEDVRRIVHGFRVLAARSAIVRDARRHPPTTIGLAFLVFGFLGHLLPVAAPTIAWLFSELYLITILGVTLWTWRRAVPAPRPLGRILAIHLPVILLAVAWGLSPYVGLRTTGVFTMFSGLRTEGSLGNHLFMPTYRLGGWQDELVLLESSNDPELSQGADLDLAVPMLEIQRRAAEDPDLVVTGELDGVRHSWGPEDGSTPVPPASPWALKLLLFRPVQAGDTPFCSIS